MGTQDRLEKFYDIENLVTVNVTMPEQDWQALKNAEPHGGRDNWTYIEKRYDWYKATSVSISGTKFPVESTFYNVGIIKKSFAGSFSTTKPSLRLDFGKYDESNEDGIEALIGSKNMTLNNSIQDDSYIRQPLGYELFRQAGVPSFRCSFAKVIVNNTDMGRFVENKFADNTKGNAYEIELGQDLVVSIIDAGYLSFEGLSKFEDKKDIRLASEKLASEGLSAMQQLIDVDAFVKFFAMETMLKHWDGYTQRLNNTYLYNDTRAVANPDVSNIKIKFIPSGIDQILQASADFVVGNASVLAKLVGSDDEMKAKLFTQIRLYANSVFSADNHETVLTPFIDHMVDILQAAGSESAQIEGPIDAVREQLSQIRSGALEFVGETALQGTDL